ncbi:unnamed protein product [Didymodactylos carnosus]|uniref:Chitin-binding type-2 domain-containing protein n=1 Tax=Didymodactylos carnosus TaxID=1234261 RepID=A0A814EME6_9BILA|nr:unnamed protein product [Didymodactylos carnosus]CAF0969957.1 unnamed protein product [Didymodactylos carnosus]CAF3610387.1 unnamed protein product [Didymodactylos carnosus]CAF3743104.1 unnamed protein product [Didymodactylos carnosus]
MVMLLIILLVVSRYVFGSTTAFICPQQNGLFGSVNNRHQFYHCANGIAYLKECPLHLSWSQEHQQCDWDKYEETSSPTTPTTSSSTTSTRLSSISTALSSTSTTLSSTTATADPSCPSSAQLLTFDDIPDASRSESFIPSYYGKIYWELFNYLNVTDFEQRNGTNISSAVLKSGEYVAVTNGKLTKLMFSSPGNLYSFWVSNVWNAGYQFTGIIYGKLRGLHKYTKSLTFPNNGPHLIELNWKEIDLVEISTSSGRPQSQVPSSYAAKFALDNMCVEIM